MISPIESFADEIESVPKWQELRSVQDVCRRYPKLMDQLLQALDLDRKGLETVRAAVKTGKRQEACRALLAYCRDGRSTAWLRRKLPKASKGRDAMADGFLKDQYTFYTQADTVPRREDGGLEWNHAGPAEDQEWAWGLNRMPYLRRLEASYFKTGNPVYVKAIDAILRDWIMHSQPYPAKRSNTSMWRGLEVHFRAKVWSQLFFTLQKADAFRPATRLLMLQSLVDHADYLRRFHAGGNWLTMELSGLTAIATRFPELKKSEQNLEYAGKVLLAELSRQVYPDGAQTELTAAYHWVALRNFEQYMEYCRVADIPENNAYRQRVIDMYGYLAGVLRPDGTIPLNNDSNKDDLRGVLQRAAGRYDKETWRYVATNGKKGKAPEVPPSRIFPYAGHVVSRSGWNAGAQWSFFDLGPWGTGHQNSDKLHLSVHAGGRDLLVDSGRFAYRGKLSPYRSEYGVKSRAHNVILFDNRGQRPNERSVKEPLSGDDYAVTEAFDYARGSISEFDGLEQGDAAHTRILLYVRDRFWIIVDRVETNAPRRVTTLWHWHPDCTVTEKDGRIFSTDKGRINLSVQPVGDAGWTVRMVKGHREGDEFQGWYSARYNSVEKNWAALCNTRLDGRATYVWLLVPGQGAVPRLPVSNLAIDDAAVRLTVDLGNDRRCRVHVPVVGAASETEVRIGP